MGGDGTAGDSTGTMDNGCFDFDDMKALRDEYEERVRRAERERDAAIDVLKRDAENRIATLQREHEARVAREATARQELIEDLTIELAAAREDGEMRARTADEQRASAETLLRRTLADVSRIEAELARVREILTATLAPAPTAPVSTPPATEPRLVDPPETPAASPEAAATSVTAVWGSRRKKIRLR